MTARARVLMCAGLCVQVIGGAPLLAGLQRAVPLVFADLAALAAVVHWRDGLVEGRRALRVIVITGTAHTQGMLAVRLGSPRGRPSELAASIDATLLRLMIAVVAWRLLGLAGTVVLVGTGWPTAPCPIRRYTARPRPACR